MVGLTGRKHAPPEAGKTKDKRQKLRNPALRGKLRDEIPQNGNKRQKTKDKWQMANGKRIQFFNLF